MRAVIQRVSKAEVRVGGKTVGAIDRGLLVLLGVAQGDEATDAKYLADKIADLRIFETKDHKMNLSVRDIQGQILVVSQFTLLADCRKGRRPGFTAAAEPDVADRLYEEFISSLRTKHIDIATGSFRTNMQVSLTNEGPVTLLLDSRKNF